MTNVGRRFLVTGGTGFVGRHVVSALISQGHSVCIIGRTPAADVQAEFVSCDLLKDDPAEALRRVRADVLVHMAWVTEHGEYWQSPDNAGWQEASLNLVRAFREAGGRRAVVAGTCAEYGSPQESSPLLESVPAVPNTPYGEAKNACRIALENYAAASGLDFAWGRLFIPYGPDEDCRRLIPSVVRALLEGREAPCSSGRQKRDFMFVEDMGRAVAELAVSDVEGIVNIGSGEQVTVADIVKTIGEQMQRPDLIRLGALPDRTQEPESLVADIDRLKNEVGFRARYSLYSGLDASVAYWRQSSELPPAK